MIFCICCRNVWVFSTTFFSFVYRNGWVRLAGEIFAKNGRYHYSVFLPIVVRPWQRMRQYWLPAAYLQFINEDWASLNAPCTTCICICGATSELRECNLLQLYNLYYYCFVQFWVRFFNSAATRRP